MHQGRKHVDLSETTKRQGVDQAIKEYHCHYLGYKEAAWNGHSYAHMLP